MPINAIDANYMELYGNEKKNILYELFVNV